MATSLPAVTGEELTAEDGNRISGIISQVAGATISGATTPVACFKLNSDNEWYNCDANDLTKVRFEGFAITDGTDGNSFVIQTHGIVDGFSGLTEGAFYYVQDDGTLGTSFGTYPIQVGVAISTTQILIQKSRIVVHGAGANWSKAVGTSDSGSEEETITCGFRPKEIIVTARVFSNIDSNNNVLGSARYLGTQFMWRLEFYSGGASNGQIKNYEPEDLKATFNGGSVYLTIANLTDTGFDLSKVWSTGATFSGTVEAENIDWIAIG
jgi:hypothetical protein|tara:strand:+ start:5489 stop:6289 length:801 start_codon:yes stop_codon:yes gene_type:complete